MKRSLLLIAIVSSFLISCEKDKKEEDTAELVVTIATQGIACPGRGAIVDSKDTKKISDVLGVDFNPPIVGLIGLKNEYDEGDKLEVKVTKHTGERTHCTANSVWTNVQVLNEARVK